MSRTYRILSIVTLCALLALTFATPVYAFDGRGGDKVVIQSGQVVNDDLYVGANQFVLDGTVNGDLVAFGQIVTVNGTVNGDLITAAQTVVINGTITGAVRAAGSVLFVGEKAKIGKDLLAAGYSLETRPGSSVGRDIVVASGQTLLAGDATRNVTAYTGALQIDGTVGGNVKAEVGETNQTQAGPPPGMFMGPSTVPVPLVKQGLTVDPAARIAGNLQYTQNADLVFPAGVISGSVTRVPRPVEKAQPTPQQTLGLKVGAWVLGSARSLITLILLGLLLAWLFPLFLKSVSEKLQRAAVAKPSLGRD